MNEKRLGTYFILLTLCLTILTCSIIFVALKISDLKNELKKLRLTSEEIEIIEE